MRHALVLALLLTACSSDTAPLPSSDPPPALDALGSGMTAGLAAGRAGSAGRPMAGSAAPDALADAGAPDTALPEADAAEPATDADSGPAADLQDAASPPDAVLPPELFVGIWTAALTDIPCDAMSPATDHVGFYTLTVNPDYTLTFGQGPDLMPRQGALVQGELTWSRDSQATYRVWLLTPDSLQGVVHTPASGMFSFDERCSTLAAERQ